MKIKQTFTIEHPRTMEGYESWELDREQAEELLAALQEALGYGSQLAPIDMLSYSEEDGGWEEPVGEQLTPDEAAARLQAMGQNSPRSSMPAGWKGNSSIGTRSAD